MELPVWLLMKPQIKTGLSRLAKPKLSGRFPTKSYSVDTPDVIRCCATRLQCR
jgi:hypothetical protein